MTRHRRLRSKQTVLPPKADRYSLTVRASLVAPGCTLRQIEASTLSAMRRRMRRGVDTRVRQCLDKDLRPMELARAPNADPHPPSYTDSHHNRMREHYRNRRSGHQQVRN